MNYSFDIIPDIHGQFEKLMKLLLELGWCEIAGHWQHSDKKRRIIFLGDFIDRGEQNRKVICLIRKLEASKLAYVIMGNHELNAIYFHSKSPKTGSPLRKHSSENIKQHKSFLREFPLGTTETEEIINWFSSLPLFLDFHSFRAVHACWANSAIETVQRVSKLGIFSREFYIESHFSRSKFYSAIELITKGPEASLPQSKSFTDKTGVNRRNLRLAWWRHKAFTWRDLSASAPNSDAIPNIVFEKWDEIELYPKDAVPVFFGHYWMSFPVAIESENALCLDYSAGTTGPLIGYHFDPIFPALNLNRVTCSN